MLHTESFFDAIGTRQLAGCVLSDGDTTETLLGRARQYCIAIESFDESKIAAVKEALSLCDSKGLLPRDSRFLDDALVRSEPLPYSARINAVGELVDCQNWAVYAWKESKEKRRRSRS